MIEGSEFNVLQGSEIIEDKGLDEGGVHVDCSRCGRGQRLTADNAAGYYVDRWLCNSCRNNLQIRWDGDLHQPTDLLYLVSKPLSKSTLNVGDTEYEVVREDSDEFTRTHLTAYLLNREAKDHQHGIGTYNIGHHYPHIVLDDGEAVGYLLWGPTPNEYMVLRQLFIREPYRRQGIGSALVEYWWDDVAKEWCEDSDEDFYHIEMPNESMTELIVDLGHDGEDGQPCAYRHQPS
ncbi:GNAT family N-acetyltransferase [Halopiger aswanensis]|uniref:Acetyltransferase (GNAT) family protein n=1 Tax=Halopiger aswanensis TaxID=148449 RepID=A0A3R7DC67_9EURY|nr:GNAT family N-acetyltransferase [Halopiger aswanensis]RKD97821.1 acetyltransferase (GNAT) family protein [Halopiger aswanensis]